jgi:hypothetical protein
MAYKSTGNPVGRPKTKEYVTLLARVPAELAELVKRYAGQHGQSVAELIREGVEWRIGDGDPRGMGLYLGQPIDHSEKVYYTNTETALSIESGELLREIRAEQVRQGAQLQAVVQALEHRPVSGSSRGHACKTETSSSAAPTPVEPKVRSDKAMAEGTSRQTGIPLYDATRYYLGRLCPRQHDYHGSGQSLLRRHNQRCRECERLGKRAAREAKRQQEVSV